VQAGDEDSGRRQLGARNQIRRFLHACPDCQWSCRAADAQRTSTWTAKYLDIAAAIGALNCRQAYVDGELCAVRPDGTTSFSALQGHGDTPGELVYFAFDLLHLDGEDLMRLPLLERKARLEALLAAAPPVLRFSGHIVGNGARVFEEGRSWASKARSRSRSTNPTCLATPASGSRPSF